MQVNWNDIAIGIEMYWNACKGQVILAFGTATFTWACKYSLLMAIGVLLSTTPDIRNIYVALTTEQDFNKLFENGEEHQTTQPEREHNQKDGEV